jgi:hypothetical protein
MRRALFVTLIGVFMLTLGSWYAAASVNAAFSYVRGTAHGIKYMEGGVGIDERAVMDRIDKMYNLKLVFAEPSGPYLASVNVILENASGKKLMQTTAPGPWFFAKLPDGKYRIVATFRGEKEVREVEIGRSLQTVTETQPVKTEAAKLEQGTNVQAAREQQAGKTEAPPAKTGANKMTAGESLQTLTFYWKA